MWYYSSGFNNDDSVFETFMEKRQRKEDANETIKQRIISELIGSIEPISILDLNSGDTKFGNK
ncbi:hypothetical protein [Bacillus solimangrovi]|uniref:Uncharacterized protein n=1 Tax=Bacillus solimangrovi TaxID=1305675 RepID=A0A1E5LB95_9BACI|nr:hypothetical protein [Bacillus solimangrovi]OEH91364.1 hypothetical protein BFG57_05730 [Bacillus solimangrovi]